MARRRDGHDLAAQRWFAWAAAAAGVALAVLSAASCGSGPQPTKTLNARSSLPPEIHFDLIVAGDGVGWIIDLGGGERGTGGTAKIWRFNADATVTRTLEVPAIGGAYATFFAGHLVYSGVRCGEHPCQSTVNQLYVVATDGRSAQTVVLSKQSEPPGDAAGVKIVGTSKDRLWVMVQHPRDVVAIDRHGKIVDRIPWPTSGPCVAAGHLYGLELNPNPYRTQPGPNNQPSTTIVTPGGPPPTPGQVRVTEWNGSQWRPVARGTWSGNTSQKIDCSGTGYQIGPWGSAPPTDAWTPSSGWKHIVGAPLPSGPPLFSSPDLSSTGRSYRLANTGELFEITPTSVVPVGHFMAPTKGFPPSIRVDDSGSVLFACSYANNSTHCKVMPKR